MVRGKGSYVVQVFQGAALGVAMIIPGVSGGTMALVLGIYERLIKTIERFGPACVKNLLPPYPDGYLKKWAAEFKRLDVTFLCCLGGGAMVAILVLAKVLPVLMQKHHDPTYGFFWGLILASIVVPLKLIKRFGWQEVLALFLGIAVTVALSYELGRTSIDKAERKAKIEIARKSQARAQSGSDLPAMKDVSVGHLFYILIAGAVAMSACVLPGVSGSFVMLLFGVYFDVLQSVNRLRQFQFNLPDMLTVGVAAVGCLLGLVGFTRFLTFVFKRCYNQTMAILIGLMLGSLYGIWPFKHSQDVLFFKGLKRVDALPKLPEINGNFWLTMLTVLAGIGIVTAFEVIERRKGKPEQDISGGVSS